MSAPRLVLAVGFSVSVLLGCVATGAGAYATIAPPPSASPSSGLPDGRVYELASPFNKHGYQVGESGLGSGDSEPIFSISSSDGNAVSFEAKGPAGEVDSGGLSQNFVAERASDGWTSRSTTARGLHQNEEVSLTRQTPIWRDYSPDLSHLVYSVEGAAVAGATKGNFNFYLLGSEPLAEPTWLLREMIPPKGTKLNEINPPTQLVGMSPDASVVYIADEAQLLPQDASRTGWGLYEYRNGTLREAGVLPDGSVPAGGALPPSTNPKPHLEGVRPAENNPDSLDNPVSDDGMRVFFQSSGEIYVHETEADGSERSVLISASQLPGHVGEDAPDGVVQFENPGKQRRDRERSGNYISAQPTYAYASSDGSHVFFQSIDQLTSEAPVGSEPKVYDFDVDTGSLEYLSEVNLGGIVTAAADGSSFVFVDRASAVPELDLWSATASGGRITQIAQLPGGGFVGPGRMVAADSVLVFQAQAPIAGFNDVGGEQVYRYAVTSNELSCISCPPTGIHASGSAYLSSVDQYFSYEGTNPQYGLVVNDTRGVSDSGERVFFGSPDPLVGRDTNGQFDTYEWENGTVFLISAGTGAEPSWYLDNSQSGGDVFFTTSSELVEGDTDAGYDIYDARVPRPGDNPPPSAAPCTGASCQGPSSAPQLMGAPSSSTFSGVGNVLEESAVSKTKSTPKKLSRAQKLASALRACREHKTKSKRATCEGQARKRYRIAGGSTKHNGGRGK